MLQVAERVLVRPLVSRLLKTRLKYGAQGE